MFIKTIKTIVISLLATSASEAVLIVSNAADEWISNTDASSLASTSGTVTLSDYGGVSGLNLTIDTMAYSLMTVSSGSSGLQLSTGGIPAASIELRLSFSYGNGSLVKVAFNNGEDGLSTSESASITSVNGDLTNDISLYTDQAPTVTPITDGSSFTGNDSTPAVGNRSMSHEVNYTTSPTNDQIFYTFNTTISGGTKSNLISNLTVSVENIEQVPEPSSALLLSFGFLILGQRRR